MYNSRQPSLGRAPVLLVALGCFFWFGYHWYISHDSLKWPAHTGQISEVKIETQSRRRGTSSLYLPRVFYHFVHDHVSYEGSELLNSSTSLQKAEQSASMWQHGQRLQVYYNPRDPKQNSLHQGEQLETDGLLAGLAVVVIIGVLWSSGSVSTMR
jgi:hypothetical protein